MKLPLILTVVGIILVGGALVVGFVIFREHSTPNPQGITQFPTASTTNPLPSGGSASPTMNLAANDSVGTVAVKDFIHNGVTAADVENQGKYYLAGSPGYCMPDGTCPHGAQAPNYIVTYDAASQSFVVALTSEPIGTARRDATQFMLRALGVTEQDLCRLNYYLGTDIQVNPTYAGRNLGFAGCPGAVKLP
jgi:hypothetical protein